MKYKLFVFDWDGTLMDSEAKIISCMHAAIKDMEFESRSDDQIRNIIGLGFKEALTVLYPDKSALYETFVEQYRRYFLDENSEPSPLFSHVELLLELLNHHACFLAVATGKGRRGLDKVLYETKLNKYFHVTRCADETFSKPNPQMLHEIMDFVGVEPNETIMIGDTEYDLNMASNAGCESIAIAHGVHDVSRLEDCKPIEVFSDIKELYHWVEQQPH